MAKLKEMGRILLRTGHIFVWYCLVCATWAEALDLPQRVQVPPAEVPQYTVKRVVHGIAVDGRADETDWRNAAPIHFTFPWNDVEREAVQHTVAKMLWDEKNFFIIYSEN